MIKWIKSIIKDFISDAEAMADDLNERLDKGLEVI